MSSLGTIFDQGIVIYGCTTQMPFFRNKDTTGIVVCCSLFHWGGYRTLKKIRISEGSPL